jgi:hypothetical protein
MTTANKIKANRANAIASTGPKTARGRARSARNALRHALSIPVCTDPTLTEEVEDLAREIAGPNATAAIQTLARAVAEAQIDLRRVRYARYQLLARSYHDPQYISLADIREKVRLVRTLLRPKAPALPPAALSYVKNWKTAGPEKFTAILSEECKKFIALDRYERRAVSRRKFAIRAFDEERSDSDG